MSAHSRNSRHIKVLCPALALLAVLSLSAPACERKPEDQSAVPPHEMRLNANLPVLQRGEVYWQTNLSAAEQEAEIRRVLALLERILAMLDSRDLRPLREHVSRRAGIFVDLKAHQSYASFIQDLDAPHGYLQDYFLSSARLRERTGDPTRLAVRDVLRLTRVLRADLYMEDDARQCEIKLKLVDAPKRSYYLNNAVFIKEDGVWYLHQMF